MASHLFKSLLPNQVVKFAFHICSKHGSKAEVHYHYNEEEEDENHQLCARSTQWKRKWRDLEDNWQKENGERRKRRAHVLENETVEEKEKRLRERRRKYALKVAKKRKVIAASRMVQLPQNSNILSTREERRSLQGQYKIVTKVDKIEVFSHFHTYCPLNGEKPVGKAIELKKHSEGFTLKNI
ncbi:hypothetical protein FGB62_345g02 [Gracilaria domingensis]|nr:hypothetical protein FGB62_345g02 [Gracilaria domingensis]